MTLYLPVFHPGALFFLGDGHAAMGDGELTGAALETSLDVEFTVDVLRGVSIAGPRAENQDYLIAMGETVMHILGQGHVEPARMTEAAKLQPDGAVLYPGDNQGA